MEGHRVPHRSPLAQGQNPPSVAKSAPRRQDLREEPDANSACPDPCGGTGATRFPTAISPVGVAHTATGPPRGADRQGGGRARSTGEAGSCRRREGALSWKPYGKDEGHGH